MQTCYPDESLITLGRKSLIFATICFDSQTKNFKYVNWCCEVANNLNFQVLEIYLFAET